MYAEFTRVRPLANSACASGLSGEKGRSAFADEYVSPSRSTCCTSAKRVTTHALSAGEKKIRSARRAWV
jgi:hypothetical protein